MQARGTFQVKMTPQSTAGEDPPEPARMIIDKQFQGELAARSQGQMLAAGTAVAGSAGYVAIERVHGALAEREGSFVLQHNGVMARGIPQLSIVVVPDSGTGALEGLTGSMTIAIEQGVHHYVFDYAFTTHADPPGE